MKRVLRSFALFIAIGSIFHQVTLAQAAESKITTTENYYKCPPGISRSSCSSKRQDEN